VLASMTPNCSHRKEEGGPGGKLSRTFVVPDDVENIDEQEHEGLSEVKIKDPSVQKLVFSRKIGSGLSILTSVRN
jgi:hypothetical protein